jgi:hypothetical protein
MLMQRSLVGLQVDPEGSQRALKLHGQQPPHLAFLSGQSRHAGPCKARMFFRFVVLARLVERENQRLSEGAVFFPRGFDTGRENAYSDAGSPDGVLAGAIFWPENSAGTGC